MPDKRIPNSEEEAFAWGFMIGYLGDVPDTMSDLIYEPSYTPEFIMDSIAYSYRQGYDTGVAFFCDHNGDYDE